MVKRVRRLAVTLALTWAVIAAFELDVSLLTDPRWWNQSRLLTAAAIIAGVIAYDSLQTSRRNVRIQYANSERQADDARRGVVLGVTCLSNLRDVPGLFAADDEIDGWVPTVQIFNESDYPITEIEVIWLGVGAQTWHQPVSTARLAKGGAIDVTMAERYREGLDEDAHPWDAYASFQCCVTFTDAQSYRWSRWDDGKLLNVRTDSPAHMNRLSSRRTDSDMPPWRAYPEILRASLLSSIGRPPRVRTRFGPGEPAAAVVWFSRYQGRVVTLEEFDHFSRTGVVDRNYVPLWRLERQGWRFHVVDRTDAS